MPKAPAPVTREVLPLLSGWALLFEAHGSPAAAELEPVSASGKVEGTVGVIVPMCDAPK
jgi:hypothetical protein